MIPNVIEIDSNGAVLVPVPLQPYDSKSLSLSKTGSVCKGPNYLEIDINTHSFGGLSGRGYQSMFEYLTDMYTQVGFAVEGKSDDELPEVLCACVGFNKIDISKFIEI